jgi:hypothetical protein
VTSFSDAYTDLSWLADAGALDGVAEVLRERRRQLEQKGWSLAHDAQAHNAGKLMVMASQAAAQAYAGAVDGTKDEAGCERLMARAGALAAAEIDRVNGEL